MLRAMHTRAYLAAFVAVAALSTTLLAQAFNVRPGTWEVTVQMQGDLPMQGLPPAQRAQMEAQMSKPHTTTSCLTAEDIKSLNLGTMDEDPNCKTISSKIGATVGDIVRQCTGDDPHSETAHFEATTPQSLKATMTSKGAQGTMTMSMTGRWMSADCRQ